MCTSKKDDVINSLEKLTRKEALSILKELLLAPEKNTAANALALVSECLVQSASVRKSVQPRSRKTQRVFDMSKYRQRHIALHVQYDGGNYFGFASQAEGVEETVETHLFAVLSKLHLITDRKGCNYSRCGRTDKGVSALGQVVALKLRSSIPLILGAGRSFESYEEMDYADLMNRHLPSEIRILGWCEVSDEFSARFSATSRTYRYFFMRDNLDIEAMSIAAAKLCGAHDFRNMAKLDVVNVSNFVRRIISAKIVPFDSRSEGGMHMLEITGNAFLWHMVRSIMAILFLIGQKREDVDVIDALLDIEACPGRPDYRMAPELPLVLHQCGYDRLRIEYSVAGLWNLTLHFQRQLNRQNIAVAQTRNCLQFLNNQTVDLDQIDNFLEKRGEMSLVQKKRSANEMDQTEDSPATPSSHAASLISDPNDADVTEHFTQEHKVIKWMDALKLLPVMSYQVMFMCGSKNSSFQKDHDISKVPLLERSRAEAYHTRVINLQGKRKQRHTEHISMDKADGSFFRNMRNQGSIS
jgi:tRNA pseudouridine38/39 synthase